MPAVIIMPPPTPPGKKSARKPAGMPPPTFGSGAHDAGMDPGQDAGGSSLSPEEVGYSADDLCSDCAHAEGGNCGKYQFPISPNGHCRAGFEPQGGEGDSDGGDAAAESNPWDAPQ
jgi:hypothetical protein